MKWAERPADPDFAARKRRELEAAIDALPADTHPRPLPLVIRLRGEVYADLPAAAGLLGPHADHATPARGSDPTRWPVIARETRPAICPPPAPTIPRRAGGLRRLRQARVRRDGDVP